MNIFLTDKITGSKVANFIRFKNLSSDHIKKCENFTLESSQNFVYLQRAEHTIPEPIFQI